MHPKPFLPKFWKGLATSDKSDSGPLRACLRIDPIERCPICSHI